jgi:hypothetical protein
MVILYQIELFKNSRATRFLTEVFFFKLEILVEEILYKINDMFMSTLVAVGIRKYL